MRIQSEQTDITIEHKNNNIAAPQITFSRDLFRVVMSYGFLEASRLKGGSGISLLRDRDNFLFQFEYVI